MFQNNLSIPSSRVKQSKNNARKQPTKWVTKGTGLSRMKVSLHLITMLDSKNSHLPEQVGFCKQHSTVFHLVRNVNFITHGFNLNKHTGMVLLDIEKAYNTVWLDGLR